MYLFPPTFPKGSCAEGAFVLDCSLSNCNHVPQIVVDAFWNSNKYVCLCASAFLFFACLSSERCNVIR